MTWDRWVEVVVTVISAVAAVISAVAAVLVRIQWQQANQFRVPEHGDDERPGDVLRLRQPEDNGPLEAFVINPFGEDGYDDDGQVIRSRSTSANSANSMVHDRGLDVALVLDADVSPSSAMRYEGAGAGDGA